MVLVLLSTMRVLCPINMKGYKYTGPSAARQTFDNMQAFRTYQFNVLHAAECNPGPSKSRTALHCTATHAAVAFLKGAAKDMVHGQPAHNNESLLHNRVNFSRLLLPAFWEREADQIANDSTLYFLSQ
jgi:hypothetical protein